MLLQFLGAFGFIFAAPRPILALDAASSSEGVKFTDSLNPNPQRALKDIVWSCLIAALACALVSVRPNVPGRTEKSKSWKASFRRLELMCWALVAPEMMVLWSVRQWMGARRLAKEYHGEGWTMAHGHFLQMGGFMLYQDEEAKGILTPERLNELLAAGRIELPRITEAEIQDFSKRDMFFKVFAVVQTAWLVVQCVARVAYGLVLTELELITVTVALAYGAMFLFWWDKPLDVRSSIPVFLLDETKDDLTPVKVDKPAEGSQDTKPSVVFKLFTSPWLPIVTIFDRLHEITESGPSATMNHTQMRVPTFYSSPPDLNSSEEKATTLRIASGIAVMFGAIYCVGWVPGLLPFPTYEERLLWKLCSIFTAAATFTMVLDLSGIRPVKPTLKRQLLDAYLVARTVLLVESVVALRQLPLTAYTAIEWTSYLPHV